MGQQGSGGEDTGINVKSCLKSHKSCQFERSRKLYDFGNQDISTPLNVTFRFDVNFLDSLREFYTEKLP